MQIFIDAGTGRAGPIATTNVSATVLTVFTKLPTLETLEVYHHVSGPAFSRYERQGPSVIWYGPIKSRRHAATRKGTPIHNNVKRSADVGKWVRVGIVALPAPDLEVPTIDHSVSADRILDLLEYPE